MPLRRSKPSVRTIGPILNAPSLIVDQTERAFPGDSHEEVAIVLGQRF
jgi:hypothetical protein